ncbi:MAG TPA: RsmE family RNA methyltransferase, partial [Chitinophagaceae bacterium]|nr:RsmE family RNA methyltransferase [Chitinophagaceae bacterium]
SIQTEGERNRKIVIGISLIKNLSRFEWFLEKATEIGVSEIIPLICKRTEKQSFKFERMNAILISAMIQSQQCWLPLLCEPVSFQKLVAQEREGQSFIAHCLPDQKEQLSTTLRNSSSIILIGPEGDFTENEIATALEKGFKPVALGNTRLRTETAGIVAATLLVTPFNGIL